MHTKVLNIGIMGGAGFIGRRLHTRLRAAGHKVVVADIANWPSPEVDFRKCDVRDPVAVRQWVRGLDVVYNLAAEHRDDVKPIEKYEQVNVGGARVLCEAAAASGVKRLVFTSSVAVYGIPEGMAEEDAPIRPFNEYGTTKAMAEQVYRTWETEGFGRSVIVVRPTVVFGEGNRGNVYNLVRQIASGRFIMIGDGTNKKSMAYVENLAGFLVHLLSMDSTSATFNYSDGPDLEMNQFVGIIRTRLALGNGVGVRFPYLLGFWGGGMLDLFAKATGRRFPISALRVRKFCANTQISAKRAIATGYAPPFTLIQGIDRLLSAEFTSGNAAPSDKREPAVP